MDYVSVGGQRIEYRRIGAPAPGRPTIVFLHHGLGCTGTWRDFPDQLCTASGLPGFVYSRLGYGGSDPVPLPRPMTYLVDDAMETLPKVLAAAEIDDFILFGHSDGGTIALIYAGAVKHGLKAAIVEAAHIFVEKSNLDAIADTRASYQATDLREKLKRHHGDNVDIAFYGWADAWLDPNFRNFNIADRAAKIDCPVLAIRGTEDEYGSPAQMACLRAVARTDLQTLEHKCGHFPHREAEAEVMAAATKFLRRYKD